MELARLENTLPPRKQRGHIPATKTKPAAKKRAGDLGLEFAATRATDTARSIDRHEQRRQREQCLDEAKRQLQRTAAA
jgi:hypothetical protein